MFDLYRRKIILFLGLLLLTISASAQEHNPLYDNKPVRFGFAITGIQAKMKFTTSESFALSDTLQYIEPISFPGIGLGGLANIRLSKYFDLRAMINLQLVQRNLDYHFKGEDNVVTAKIESTYMEFPLLLKYKSKRHKNWRLYVIGGLSYRYDFISDIETERSNSRPIVALYPNTFGYEIGFGFSYYHNFAKISPEFRLSNALGNHLVPDQYIFASSLQKLLPKLLQFSIVFN
ncbi:PorT family protein [bacterium]|nr:PorT family protein [bacterium]